MVTFNSTKKKNTGGGNPSYVGNNQSGYSAESGSGEKNKGGILGGLGYVGASLLAGVGSVGEGIIDLVLALGADITGNHDFAEYVFKDNTVGNWYSNVQEDFNPGEGWGFAGDVGHGLGQSSVFLLNLIPGLGQLGTAAFFAGVGSQGISSAAATTGDVGLKEVGYGIVSGAVEGALEKALGGMGKIGSKALGNITKTAVRKGLVGQILSDAAGEFGEEFASEYIDTFLQRGFQIDPNKTTSLRDALYAGAVGFTSGAVSAGSANVLKAIGNERVGDRIVKSGNSQTLVNTATKVADKLAAQGTNWDRAGEWVKALRGQVDAYNKLSENEKTSMRGKTILGEMKSSLFFAETQSTFDLVKKSIQNSDEQTRATFAEYINKSVEKGKRNGKDYTAADIAKDTDGVAWQLAIYKFVPSLFDIDGALADMQQESEIADVVAKAQNGEVIDGQYSFEGYAEDGKGMYRSNFPKGTPKTAKSKVILDYIQNVWSKNPINLKINENGETKTITAQFDPTYSEDKNVRTDASKLMGGNRHGTASDQRVTLDLADDYYQIASESEYNYSKDETGKDTPTHEGVRKWHYFVNDIYFSEFDGEEYKPYRVTINVKEKSDGNYVYSFSAEAQEGSSTPQTLHAVVNGDNEVTANAQPSKNIIRQKDEVVNPESKKISSNNEIDENAVNLRSDAVKVEGEQTGAETMQDETAGASPRPTGEFNGEVDLERAKRDAERIIEWERKEAPTVDELNRVRGAVKNFDSLSGDRQRAIVRMVRSGKNIDEGVIRGVSNIMAITNKKGAVLAPDVEIRFAEFGKDSTRRGIKTEVGGKTVIVLNANAKSTDILRGTIAHEIVHYLENRKGYKALAEYAMKHAKADKVAKIRETYEGVYEGENAEAKIEGEVVASVVAELLGSEKFLKRYAQMGEEQSSVVKRIARFVKGIANALKDKDGEASEVAANMMDLVDRALGSEVSGEKRSNDYIQFSLMSNDTLEESVDKIISMSDEDAIANKEAGNFISIAKKTPQVILDHVEGAENLEIVMRFDSFYLATRHEGALDGHYHNYGNIMKQLPKIIADPQAIIKMDNGRINIYSQIQTKKGNNSIVSIELNTVKDINSKYNKYNLIVSVVPAKDNYARNNLEKHGVKVEYEKEDLSQVNHQLHEWLAIVNERSSKDSIHQNKPVVNTSDKKSSDKVQYDLDPEAVEREAKRLTPKTEKTEKKKAESAVPENGKTYTKKSLVDAIETVLSEFKSELFGTSMVTLSKSKITKLVDDHLYRQMNRKTDDSEKGSISTKLVVASMLDDYLSYLRVTDENGNIRKLTDVYSESEIDEIKQKLVNYLTEEINNRGVRTVDAEQKGEKFAKKEDDRQLKKRAERGGFTEKDTRDAVKRVAEYTDEQLSELFDSQSAKVSKVQKEEFARDLLMALTTKDGKKRIKQIVDRFASDYVDKVRITVDGKRTYLSSLYDDEGIAALKKELAEKIQKDLTSSGKDSLYIDIINRLENAKREFSRDLLDAEKTFKYGNAIIAEAEKLKENVGYRKRSVNDSVIYMLEKEMAKIVDHQKQISLSSVNKAIKMWSDFYNKDNPLLNQGGTLTDTASDYFDIMRVKIDDFLASRKSREGYALNGREMELLSQIVGSARSILINHDTRFLDGKRISVKEGIYSFIKDQDTYNSTRSKGGKSPESSFGKWLDKFGLTKIGQATNQGYLYKIIAPEALIGNIEGYSHDGLLSKAYNAVQSGADKSAKLRAQLLSPFENFLDGRNADGQKDESLLWEDEKGRKHNYRDRLLNKTFEFQGEQITYGESIYYYGITKRAQAEKSLNIEGVSVYDDKTGKFRTEFEDIDIDSIQAELESHFTDLDYKYIEMFEKLFNADARRIKGEADIEFAGWTNLVSGYYIPLIKDAFTRDNSVSERPAIENLMIYYKERFQKHTTDNAKQLQIVNIQSVIESYVSGLASYVHLSQPMKTFDMLWNGTIWLDENGNMVDEEEVYKGRSSQNEGENSHKYKRYSIRKTVNRDVWQGADKYFIDLFNDIQGKRNMSDFDRAVSKWTGRWASGVLGANIKVIFTQTTSLVAATKNISPKNIASALSILSNKKAFAEVAKRADEYSDIIFPRSFDSGATRSQGNIDKLEDFNKNWGKGIEITDRAVCILLYHAAEIQVERTRGFKIGSEENANAAKKLADRTIHETQAMTSQTERSAWQRETNLIAKTVTMFSSDAAKQLSYLYNAASRLIAHHRRVQNGDTSYEGDIKADKKALRRALAVSLSTTAMLTAIAQLFKLLYHQEEEEPEDQAVDVLKDFTSNALGILPLTSEIYDKIFNDYDVSIMVLDMFNTVVDDGSTLVENVFKTASGEYISTNQIVKPMYNIAKNVSTMMGIPLAPAMRTVTGLVRRISPGTAYAAHDSFLYNMSYTSDLKKAVENGDTALASHILETLYNNEINAMVTSTELEEITRLYKLGNTNVIPQKIGTTVNDVTLDRKQRAQFESIYSQASAKVNELIRSEYYAELDDEQRAKAIKTLYSLYYNRAAAEVAGVEWSNAQAYSRLTDNYAALFASQTYKSGLSPYKTLRGKEVSVKDQFVKYVENLGLNEVDKLVVLYANGYRDAKTKKKMLAYINSLSISEEEKTRIAERLGFALENGKVVEKKEELEVRG